jgi:hypothetical protein
MNPEILTLVSCFIIFVVVISLVIWYVGLVIWHVVTLIAGFLKAFAIALVIGGLILLATGITSFAGHPDQKILL